MNARSPCVLLLATCLLLAGCSALPGGNEQTPTPTAEPTSPWGEPIPIEDADFAPGTGPETVDNVSALLSAHRGVLAETDYRLRFARFRNGPEGYANVSFAANRSLDGERARYRIDVVELTSDGDRLRTIDRYDEGDTAYRRIAVGSNTSYDTVELPPFDEVHASLEPSARDALRNAQFGEPSAYTSDNRTYVEYVVTGYEFEDDRFISEFDGTLVVRDDGLIVDLWVHVVTQQGTYSVEQVYEPREDVSVEEPDWTDRAANGSD